MTELIRIIDLKPGDVVRYGKDQVELEVKSVDVIGAGLGIIDFTDGTATSIVPVYQGATVVRRA